MIEWFKIVLDMRIKKALEKLSPEDLHNHRIIKRLVYSHTKYVYQQLSYLQVYCEEHPPDLKRKNKTKTVYWPDEKYKNIETPVLGCHTFERYLDEEEEEFPEKEEYPGNRDEEDLYT